MRTLATLSVRPALAVALAMAAMLVAGSAQAAVTSYIAHLDGLSEATPNASPATGFAQVDIDPVAHTMQVHVDFSGLLAPNTACHIHAATAVAGTGTAGVASTSGTFTGFPTGTTSASYDHLFDTTLTSSFNSSYVTANGGTASSAEAALFAAIAAGKAYVNLHTSVYPGGEIRGFLTYDPSTPAAGSTWGRIKVMYR